MNEREAEQVERANASGLTPVVFVHGLWFLPSSWDRWAALFEEAGFTALSAPAGPTIPPTVEAAKAPSRRCSRTRASARSPTTSTTIIRRARRRKPRVVGHSFGGLLTQILAGRGLAQRSVALDPAPFRGVLPLPISALRSAGRARQSRQLQPRRSAHVRAVPLRVRERGRRGGGQGLYETLGPGLGRADLPGRDGEPQSVDRGEGRHEEPEARAAPDHGRSRTTRFHPRSRRRPTSSSRRTRE